MSQKDPGTDNEDAELLRAVDESAASAKPVVLEKPADPRPWDVGTAAEAPSPEAEAAPQQPAPAAPAQAERASRRGTPLGTLAALLLGGAITAAGGYAAAVYNLLPGRDTSALEARLGSQAQDIAALRAALADRPAPAPDPALAARIAKLESAAADPARGADLAALAQRLATAESALTALKSAPPGTASGGADAAELAALKSQVEALQSGAAPQVDAALAEVNARIEAAGQEARQMRDAAAAAARKSLAQAAVGRISAALDTGMPFGSAVADLAAADAGAELPAVLGDAAASGLPTLVALRDSFPQAARQGLEAALKADMGSSWSERSLNFLRSQTGARSLTARDGNDPDAILSRADAALGRGDVPAALAEVKSLSQPAQAAMSGWIATAETRVAAQAALATLISGIGAE